MIDPKFLVIDLFCGAGGTTTGFAMTKDAIVIACINHDHKAILSHWLNNPEVEHFEEDITKFYGYEKYGVFFQSDEFLRLKRLVKLYRAFYPNAKLILWASLECTNFSKAKGGGEKNADSRTLAEHLKYYYMPLEPEIIQIENVVEFMSWGPLDENNKPLSRKNGSDWLRWRKEICDFGYVDEWRELNSADFGAYTSRNRLFGMFACERNLIAWPEPTHTKKPSNGSMFDQQQKWKPVKEVLDLQDEGNSIFARKKELSPKTLERIYAGLLKYVANGEFGFMSKYYSTSRPQDMVKSFEVPADALKCKDGHSLIKTNFLVQRNTGNPNSKIISVDSPARTLTGTGGNQEVVTAFLTKYYSTGGQHSSMEEPAGTLPTKDRMSKVQTVWIDRNFTNGGNIQSVDEPAGSILKTPKLNVVKVDPFIMNTNYNNVGTSIEQPVPPLMASRRHYYIVNPAWGGNNGSVEQPCCTIVARQDKAPLYLVAAEPGEIAIPIYEGEPEIMIKIKEFMVIYGIVDIKMRMLKVPELLKIQGFPNDYKLEGNQTDQKKFIGNSVVPLVVKSWTEALANNLQFAA